MRFWENFDDGFFFGFHNCIFLGNVHLKTVFVSCSAQTSKMHFKKVCKKLPTAKL